MEESFCRLGIFIRPHLQFLVCFVCFMGIYHPGYISFISLFANLTTNSLYLIMICLKFEIIIMIFIARPTCKISHNFGVCMLVCGGPHRKPCGVTSNVIFLSPFPLLLFLFPYCWLESMGQVLMSQNLCFNWPNMLQSQMLRDVHGLHSFPLWHKLPGAGFTKETWTLFCVWLWV